MTKHKLVHLKMNWEDKKTVCGWQTFYNDYRVTTKISEASCKNCLRSANFQMKKVWETSQIVIPPTWVIQGDKND